MAKIIILSGFFIAFSTMAIFGRGIKLVERIEFSPETELPLIAISFCVTEDELLIIPDYGAKNIKAYERIGTFLELVKIITLRGYESSELQKPTACFYNKMESKFLVLYLGIRKIFVYDRIGRIDFKRVKDVPCLRGAYDIQLEGSRLFISGYRLDPNENPYDFYYIDLTNDKTVFLLPSYLKYGLKSFREYEIQYRSKLVIPVIGINGFFDINRDEVYFVWEGNLKVIKQNIITGEMDTKAFGIQSPHYVKPYASEVSLTAYRKGDFNLIQKERNKMSHVRNIFTSSKYVLVIYEGPVNQSNASNFRLQFYTLDGYFEKEVPIPGHPNRRMWFDKDRHILYSLSSKSDAQGGHYFILKYKMHE